MRIYCLPDFPHHPFPWASGAVYSWIAATTTVLITTVVSPGITNGDREGCLKPDRGLFKPCN